MIDPLVLVVDDEEEIIDLATFGILDAFPSASIARATSLDEAMEVIQTILPERGKRPIVMLLDQQILGHSGTEIANAWAPMDPEKRFSLVIRWTGNPMIEKRISNGDEGRADVVFGKPTMSRVVAAAAADFVNNFQPVV